MTDLAFVSLLLTALFTELTNLVPGGMIVPFYFALYAGEPLRILLTVVSAFCVWGLGELLSRVTILYGRREYMVYLLLGLLLRPLFGVLAAESLTVGLNLSMTIGYLVPGILARTMKKQGPVKTLLACLVVTLLTVGAQAALRAL